MYYTKEQKEEILLQIKIANLKTKIKEFLNGYIKMEESYGLLTKEEVEESYKLYQYSIAKLNELFYGYNVSNMVKYLKDSGYKVYFDDLISVMNIKHLKYYKTMLNNFYKDIRNQKIINQEICIAIATNIGERAFNYFKETNESLPIVDLISVLEITKQQDLKQETKKETRQEQIRKLKETNKILKQQLKDAKEENKSLKRKRK